jgi:hypothetical protein
VLRDIRESRYHSALARNGQRIIQVYTKMFWAAIDCVFWTNCVHRVKFHRPWEQQAAKQEVCHCDATEAIVQTGRFSSCSPPAPRSSVAATRVSGFVPQFVGEMEECLATVERR